MYHLIKKDILMQKRTLKLSLVFMLFFAVTLSSIGSVGLMVGILAITYQLVFGASILEDKTNSDIILNSLPIKQSTIVFSKYVSIFVYTAYAIVGYYVIYFLVTLFKLPLDVPFSTYTVIGGILAVTLFFSISFPFIFKYGYVKAKMANFILFFVFVFGGAGLFRYLSQHVDSVFVQNLSALITGGQDTKILLVLAVLMILILGLSFFVSLRFYRDREF